MSQTPVGLQVHLAGDVLKLGWKGLSNLGHHVWENWGAYTAIGGMIVCIAASAGVCLGAGVAIAFGNYANEGLRKGFTKQAAGRLGFDLVTAGALGYAGKAVSLGVKSARGKVITDGAWQLRGGWKGGAIAKTGPGAGRGAHAAGIKHGTRMCFTCKATVENLQINSVITTGSMSLQTAGWSLVG